MPGISRPHLHKGSPWHWDLHLDPRAAPLWSQPDVPLSFLAARPTPESSPSRYPRALDPASLTCPSLWQAPRELVSPALATVPSECWSCSPLCSLGEGQSAEPTHITSCLLQLWGSWHRCPWPTHLTPTFTCMSCSSLLALCPLSSSPISSEHWSGLCFQMHHIIDSDALNFRGLFIWH